MTMTAARLCKIVCDVSEDATPMIYYDPSVATWRDLKNHAQVLTPLAEAAFVGAMVRYLENNHGGSVGLVHDEDGYCVMLPFASPPYGTTSSTYFNSRIEALAAACKATKQEDDDGN